MLTSFALTLAGGVVVVGGAGTAGVERADRSDARFHSDEPVRGPAARLMRRYDCSTVGYGDGATPQSALVRGPRGRLRAVTFEEGWAVHTADGPSVLVAVCLRPPG